MGCGLSEKAVLEDSVAKLIEANETEADPDAIADNLRFIAIGQDQLEKIEKLMPDS